MTSLTEMTPTSLATSDGSSTLSVDTSIYSWSALFRACYKFTDRCYLYLRRDSANEVVVRFTPKCPETKVSTLIGEFENELIDQRLRTIIDQETRPVRELIVSQAFAEMRTSARPSL